MSHSHTGQYGVMDLVSGMGQNDSSPTKLINGQERSRDETVIENMNLVKKVAMKYEGKGKPVGLDFEDLVSFGTIGLIKAFDDFDESLGFRFSTYAFPKIKGEINTGILKSNAGLYYPISVRVYADRIAYRELEGLSVEELSKVLNISVSRVKHVLAYNALGIPDSLDREIEDDDTNMVSDLVGKDHDLTSIEVDEFLSLITEKERNLIKLLSERYSFRQIAGMCGCSSSYVQVNVELIRRKWIMYQEGNKVKGKRKYTKRVNG